MSQQWQQPHSINITSLLTQHVPMLGYSLLDWFAISYLSPPGTQISYFLCLKWHI